MLLMDVGQGMNDYSNTNHSIENCVSSLTKFVENKIFHHPKDEVGFVLFGTQGE